MMLMVYVVDHQRFLRLFVWAMCLHWHTILLGVKYTLLAPVLEIAVENGVREKKGVVIWVKKS